MTADEDEDGEGSDGLFRVITFEREMPVPPDGYQDNVDVELSSASAQSLMTQLIGFDSEFSRDAKFTRDKNTVIVEKEDRSSLHITCFGPHLFDVIRQPSEQEISAMGKVMIDLAVGIDAGAMSTLARDYIINGRLDD